MSNNNQNSNPLSEEYATTISLLNIYLEEWRLRDQLLWSQMYRFFYAILIIILLPNLDFYLKSNLPSLPMYIFRCLGLFFSFIFLYVSWGYTVRLHAITDTYQSIIYKLPDEYRRKSIQKFKYKKINIGKIFKLRLDRVICLTLFLILFSLSIILMII